MDDKLKSLLAIYVNAAIDYGFFGSESVALLEHAEDAIEQYIQAKCALTQAKQNDL